MFNQVYIDWSRAGNNEAWTAVVGIVLIAAFVLSLWQAWRNLRRGKT